MSIPLDIIEIILKSLPLRKLCCSRAFSRAMKTRIDRDMSGLYRDVASDVAEGTVKDVVNDTVKVAFGMKMKTDLPFRYITEAIGYKPTFEDLEACIATGGVNAIGCLRHLFDKCLDDDPFRVVYKATKEDNAEIVQYVLMRRQFMYPDVHDMMEDAIEHCAVNSMKVLYRYYKLSNGTLVQNALNYGYVDIYRLLVRKPTHEDLERAITWGYTKMVRLIVDFVFATPCCFKLAMEFGKTEVLEVLVAKCPCSIKQEVFDCACRVGSIPILDHCEKNRIRLKIREFPDPPGAFHDGFTFMKRLTLYSGEQRCFVETIKTWPYLVETICNELKPMRLTLSSIRELIEFYSLIPGGKVGIAYLKSLIPDKVRRSAGW